jgi:hypothetical protein
MVGVAHQPMYTHVSKCKNKNNNKSWRRLGAGGSCL